MVKDQFIMDEMCFALFRGDHVELGRGMNMKASGLWDWGGHWLISAGEVEELLTTESVTLNKILESWKSDVVEIKLQK